MIDPASGPFVFDTSAESYLGRTGTPAEIEWLARYSSRFPVYVAVLTVVERARGYFIARERAAPARRTEIERIMMDYVRSLRIAPPRVLDLTAPVAFVAAQLMSMLPSPPSSPRHVHKATESRQDRLSRWRFDIMIAATALARNLPLVHNNPQDFEPLHAVIERMPGRFPGVGPLHLISVKRLAA